MRYWSALYFHKSTSPVIGKVPSLPSPMQATKPDHGEHVVTIRQNLGYGHMVSVRIVFFISSTRWIPTACISILCKTAPFKCSSAMPPMIVHMPNRYERSPVKATFMVIAMPFHSYFFPASPDSGRIRWSVSCGSTTTAPDRRARSKAIWYIAINRVVWHRVFQVIVSECDHS